ncbi:GNAT family N-acetyltransferase [Enterococcus sp. 669A]|uniref:GNAT family N-acetyltransferase n=1 Tax=Candidatus Enterococcus moelleringii TaxID=2815325 RepID=A0ABS3LAT5_9ENTE|nr:GNAT family N-acetyltransferase [Enterococcus sp. 669A]MBO1306742.1 GNAT family N-acetyltransferase [Enterococcus sp. 669A]
MDLTIQPVNQDNWRQVAQLSVQPEQRDFIESNAQSLLEAAYDRSLNWHPLALYDGDTMVGFAMIGAHRDESMWLDRIMMDQHFQGQSYGKHFIPLLLDYMQTNFGVEKVYLSAHEENEKIFAYYERFGFIDSGKHDPANGERIMFYSFSK